jgi:hypothetical protein
MVAEGNTFVDEDSLTYVEWADRRCFTTISGYMLTFIQTARKPLSFKQGI